MTKDDLKRANEIVEEIERINKAIEVFMKNEEVCLMPEKVVLDGGFTKYVKAEYKFTGELKQEFIKVLINERAKLEAELLSI